MHIVTIDFESFWDSKTYTLSKMGPIEYIRDPRFHAQLLAIRVDRGPVTVFEDKEIEPVLRKLDIERNDMMLVGHNINGFDALVLSEHYGIHPKWIFDTMAAARWSGIARCTGESHAALTYFLGNGIKEEGTVVSNGKHWPHGFTAHERAYYKKYCGNDVLQCSENLFKMLPFCTPDCIRFASMTARMATEPVLWLQQQMLEQYIVELDHRAEQSRLEVCQLFNFPTKEAFLYAIRSADRFCAMLRFLGQEPPMKLSVTKTATAKAKLEAELEKLQTGMHGQSVTITNAVYRRTNELRAILANPDNYKVYTPALAKTDLDFITLQDHPDPRIALLVQTRLAHNSSIQRSRAERFLTLSKHKRPVPVMLNVYKAHTSRYTAGNSEGATDGTQFQNLNKRDPNQLTLRRSIQAPPGYKVVAVDSSQIEARILPWMAQQLDLLEQFRRGEDPYSQLAQKIFNIKWQVIKAGASQGGKTLKNYRNVGKTGILSCLAAGTEVLTDTGWVAIERLTQQHNLWDGESWVQHQGLICNGKKTTINLDGVFMTPDHLIFDGISWNRADKFIKTPSLWSRAKHFGGEKFLTCVRQNRSITFWNAPIVNGRGGSHRIVFPKLLRSIANIAHIGIVHTLRFLRGSTKILSLALCTENSQLLLLNTAEETGTSESNVVVEQKNTGSYYLTCLVENLLGATGALKRKHQRPTSKNIRHMPMYALILRIGAGFSIVLRRVYNGVKTLKPKRTSTTALAAYVYPSLPAGSSWNILSRLMDGMTHLKKWTGRTTIRATNQGIFVLSPEGKTSETGDPCQNYKTVYDILNVGSKNCFLVKTQNNYIMVHNCGYGVGYEKFSDTLLRSGVRLDYDLVKHREIAQHAHAVYRQTNSSIVFFWKRCMNVIKQMAVGGSGSFGGPNDNTFEYGIMPLPGGRLVPSVRMPSGYMIRYYNLRAEENDEGKLEYFYNRPKGRNFVKTKIYGGSFCENLCQGLAFQLLMWQACRMDEAGIILKGNNHDAWIAVPPEAEAENTKEAMMHWMSQIPEWSPGLPIACTGEIADDYTVA